MALQPRRGSELGGVSRPSRPCCLPEGSVEALATRSAHEPNELENRLGHAGARSALGAPGIVTPMVVDSILRSEGTAAPVFSQAHQELIVAVETTQNNVTPVQYAAPTMTGTRVDVNRNGTPDVLQQP